MEARRIHIATQSATHRENAGVVPITIALDYQSPKDVTIEYEVAGSARHGDDHSLLSGEAVIPAGDTAVTVSVSLVDDALDENNETIIVTLGAVRGAGIEGTQEIVLTIEDDDEPPTFIVSDAEADEAQADVLFSLQLDAPSALQVRVDYATAGITAVSGVDFAAQAGSMVFAPGETSKTVTVPIIDDLTDEPTETFSLALSSPVAGLIDVASVLGTITDSDLPPTLTVDAVVAAESDGTVSFPTSLSLASEFTITVDYVLEPLTAASDLDFVVASGTVTIAPGEVSADILLTVLDDLLDEDDEELRLSLSNETHVIIAAQPVSAVITDDDPEPTVAFTSATSSFPETSGTVEVTLTLDVPSGREVTVTVSATTSGTATATDDFGLPAATIVFAPGETTATAFVQLTDDPLVEGDEIIELELAQPTNAILGSAESGKHALTIVDDGVPSVSIAAATLPETGGTAALVVSLDRASAHAISVDYATNDLTAVDGVDYEAQSGTINFAAGETSHQVDIVVLDDSDIEGTESFDVSLSAPVNVSILVGSGTVSIFDDEVVPDTSVVDTEVIESDTSATIVIALSQQTGTEVTVDWATADDTATAGQDFIAGSGSVVFAPGEVAQSVVVLLQDDALLESSETFFVELSNESNATATNPQGTITILDEEVIPVASADGAIAAEADQTIDFAVSLSEPTGLTVTVDYSTADITATAGSDYTETIGTVTFLPGETSIAVSVPVFTDAAIEGTEQLALDVSNPTNATIGTARGIGTLFDGGVVAVISMADITVNEASGVAQFSINLDQQSGRTVTVDYATADVTAIDAADYTGAAGTLTFAPGELSKTVSVVITVDALAEPTETFELVLSNSVASVLGNARAIATVLDDDTLPDISIDDPVVSELASSLDFAVSLSAPRGRVITVVYTTQDGTAAAGADYTSTSGTLTFAEGVTSQTISVALLPDTDVEASEQFSVLLSSPTNASIAKVSGVATILDDDVIPDISIADSFLPEGGGIMNLDVTLSQARGIAITVDYGTRDDTAVAGTDYIAATGTATFPPGTTLVTLSVQVTQDASVEGTEAFFVDLSNATNASIVTATATASILDDDTVPSISMDSPIAPESAGTLEFAVFLTQATGNVITVDYTTADGTATAGTDYGTEAGTLTFAPGVTSQIVSVPLLTDGTVEGTETLSMNLNNPVGATIATVSSPGTILDVDVLPSIDIDSVVAIESDADTTFNVTLSEASGLPVSVTYATADDTATSPDDYASDSGTLIFAPGVISLPLVVALLTDSMVEGSERFVVSLSGPVNGVLGVTPGAATILDDDVVPAISIDDQVSSEDDGTAVFAVTLDQPSGLSIDVDYATADVTAVAGSDYSATAGTLTFAPGVLSMAVTVPLSTDGVVEPTEFYVVNLSSATNATIADNQGVGTVLDIDVIPSLSVVDATVSETDGTIDFIVDSSQASGLTVTVDFSTTDGSATAGADYTAAAGTLTLLPGAMSGTISIALLPDALTEGSETFLVDLSGPTNATVGDGQATGTLLDVSVVPALSISSASLPEAGGTLQLDVTLDLPTGLTVTVDYASTGVTASAGADFTAVAGTLTFAPGALTQTIDVDVLPDAAVEGTETFTVDLSNPSNATITTAQGVGTVLDDDVTPVVSVGDATVNEDAGTVDFAVTLDQASGLVVTVAHSTADSSAAAGVDYAALAGTTTFAPGVMAQVVTVAVMTDGVVEPTETFVVDLSAPANATLGDAQGIGTILDVDTLPLVNIAGATSSETDAALDFVVSLSQAVGNAVTVNYGTLDISATAGADYTAASGTLTFLPGITSASVSVAVLDDGAVEGTETLRVDLSGPTLATLGATPAIGTLLDDDVTPIVDIDSLSISEVDGNVSFTVSLDQASGLPVSVDYATADGTALDGSDYTAIAGTLTFAPGITSLPIVVAVANDSTTEGSESFVVDISNPVNGALGTAQGVATLLDDDVTPVVSIDSPTVSENVGSFDFVVSLDQPSGLSVTVDYATVDDTAFSASDYSAVSGTLTFAPGVLSQTVTVPVTADGANENTEQFFADIAGPANASLGTSRGVATILDVDTVPGVSIDNPTVSEFSTSMTFALSLSQASGLTVSIDFATADDSAAVGLDYLAQVGTVNFGPGITSQSVVIDLLPDAAVEGTETFFVNLSNPANGSISTPQGVGTVLDDDVTPTISIDSPTASENGGSMTFAVTLDQASGLSTSVDYDTANVSAVAGSDYTGESGTLVFMPGTVALSLIVNLSNDAAVEGTETFAMDLSSPTNGAFGVNQGVGTILDDDVTPAISVADLMQAEDSGSMLFAVNLDQASGLSVTVNFATANDSATAGADYVSNAGILTFAPGTTTQTVTVVLSTDLLLETTEQFFLDLSTPANATIADNQALGIILDVNTVPVAGVDSVSAAETAASVTFTVALSQAIGNPVTVNYASGDVTATAGADYTAVVGTLVFAPGEFNKTVTVLLADDAAVEGTETFAMTLSAPSNATIGVSPGTGTLFDDDVTPLVSVDSPTTSENLGSVDFAVSLDQASGATVTVDFATADDTATTVGDYSSTAGTLSFAPGVTTLTVSVPVSNDAAVEGSETFFLNLSSPGNAALGTSQGTATILDDDVTPVASIDSVTVSENAGSLVFNASLDQPSGLAVTVDYATSNSSATAGTDYTATSGSLTFVPGAMALTITVPVLTDGANEAVETFFMDLSNPGNASIGTAQGVGTILDVDTVPGISISDVSDAEAAGSLTFVVSLSQASGLPVAVTFATANGTATSGSDYTATSGTLNFTPGVGSMNVVVPLLDNSVNEASESFVVNLSVPVSASITDGSGTGGITDDDAAPDVNFTVGTQSVGEGATSATLTIQLSAVSDQDVTIPFTVGAASSAADPADYSLAPASPVTISAGGNSVNLTLSLVDDGTTESDETVIVTLGTPTNGALASTNTTQTVTIVDNDAAPAILMADTMDTDADGFIDHYRISFDMSVDDSTFPGYVLDGWGAVQSDWLVAGYLGVVLAHGASAPESDTIDDNIIYLSFVESLLWDTDGTPDVTTTATPGLTSTVATPTAQVLTADVTEDDLSEPILVRASTDVGASTVNLVFSEPVSNSGACAGTVATSNFVYGDVAAGNAGSLTGMADNDACDQLAVANVSGPFVAGDIFTDTVEVVAATMFDMVGIAVPNGVVTISGVVHPFVLNALSADSTTLRLNLSEGVDNAAALTTGNYAYTASGAGCADTPSISGGTKISDASYTFTTSLQLSACTYRLEVTGAVLDLDENATMTDPKFGTFVGNEPMRVVSATATSLRTLLVTFSKDVMSTGANGADNLAFYTVPAVIGTLTDAVRYDSITGQASDANRVQLTHTADQGSAFYSLVVSTVLKTSDDSEFLAANPFDRTTFVGLAGNVTALEEGALFSDPFGDGTTFAFVFAHGGKIYAGPNDNNDAVFRFDPDGANPVTVTFQNDSGTGGAPFPSFGNNAERPSSQVDEFGSTTRYTLTPGTDLSSMSIGDDIGVTGCINGGNNQASIITAIDDAADWVEMDDGTAGVASTAETCDVVMYNSAGPAQFSGIDAFVSASVGANDYLVFGAHKIGGGGFAEILFTQDTDSVLDNDYCTISGVTLGNTQSLQTIYGHGNYLYVGFASSQAAQPVLAYMNLSTTGAACGGLTNAVSTSATNEAREIPNVGGKTNSAANIAIDSIIVFDDGGGDDMYIANNGGVAISADIPPTSATTWSTARVDGDGTWAGTTQEIPNIGKLRPGEKGVPFMTVWGSHLFVARNRSDTNSGELWSYNAADGWQLVVDTASGVGGMNTNNSEISLLTVNGSRLYVGFDNETDGAEVWRTGSAVTDATLASNADLVRMGESGVGPIGASDLTRNKHILSNVSTLFGGDDYLYVTVGCRTDFTDNGVCDRDPLVGTTDFAIRMFRQVD